MLGFHQRIDRSLLKGKTYVHIRIRPRVSLGQTWLELFGLVACDYNFLSSVKPMANLHADQIQHNVPYNSSEGAANWVAVHYANQRVTSRSSDVRKGFAMRYGYSAED